MPGIAEIFSQAWKLHQGGNHAQAEELFRQVVQLDSSHADGWCFLGVVCQAQGKLADAEVSYRQAIQNWPGHHLAQNGLGIMLAQSGKLDEAAAIFQRLLHAQPNDADVFNNLGLVHAQQGRIDEAISCFRRALVLRPEFAPASDNLMRVLGHKQTQAESLSAQVRQSGRDPSATAQALNLQAVTLIQQGRFEEARNQLQQALDLEPDHADASINLASVFVRLERYDDAIVQYKHALRLQPDHFGAHFILGIALHGQGQFDEAETHYRQALRLNPSFAETYNSLGLTLMSLGRVEDAVAAYREALRLKPNFLEACNNLGAAREQQDLLDEAISCYEYALQLDPACAAACNNLGMVLKRQGKIAAAMGRFEETLRLDPNYASARWNRATMWLLKGDFERGWAEYEWRWTQPDFGRRRFVQPAWDGTPLSGKTILLYAEQGIGDTLQFVRYVPLVQERGGRVILQCPLQLMKLLSRLPGIERLVVKDDPLSAFDVHAALLSLPAILHTSLDDVPATVPYIQADAVLMERWRKEVEMSEVRSTVSGVKSDAFDTGHRTSETGRVFKIGIAWQGNPAFKEDRYRSIPLARFARLAQVPGVQLISLQKGAGTEQLREVRDKIPILDLGNRLDEESGPFMDTAAILKNIDLVISSDTALPHLAGALGVPVWVALPLVPDWRWLLGREDCPWYPTMRLFRQTKLGRWEDVFERIAEALLPLVPLAQHDAPR
jgi:tetratricopeptide (TPR) repeat protein